jgi:uncharacterized protein YllA (UPF0747 family)
MLNGIKYHQSKALTHKERIMVILKTKVRLLKEQLKKQFSELQSIALHTDQSFIGALKAQEIKQIKGIEHLEKRLLKAQKRKLSDVLERMIQLQNELFPNQSLQERQTNFSEFYLENGEDLIPALIEKLQPLEQRFEIVHV